MIGKRHLTRDTVLDDTEPNEARIGLQDGFERLEGHRCSAPPYAPQAAITWANGKGSFSFDHS